jgi:methylated-DNA-[protein]-cysteine S-methyltransferase
MTTDFQKRVYSECSKIPKGKVSTYGKLSKRLKSSPRAVGQALRVNPFAPKVPCHRVVSSTGAIGGFMGKTEGKEISKKIKLLKSEGVIVEKGKVLDFSKVLYE